MKMTTTLTAAAALACMIAACDGPKEKAGAAKDEAAAKAAGVSYDGNGPAERAGEAADRVDRAAVKARDSEAAALKDRGKAIRAQADAEAEKLEQEAEALRDQARTKADALARQAKTLEQKN
ncbi:hypothetical protein QUC32_27965 (plasmid) [Novosphingobium resinovorum]|uniref:hypothetical protein n=2 Tax=Novosphingobium TaxID=165696 RepID=UPI0025A1BD3A|nr:hypothetical protein [Novosphingobium resinovorum]WJM30202.1 hypothetical protein QUC32_27965 [Novosphingobium resinovorum]